jgi:hypothetical protein
MNADEIKQEETLSPIDYSILMKDTLTSIKEGVEALEQLVGELNEIEILVEKLKTALDYLFYLEDNRRTIV